MVAAFWLSNFNKKEVTHSGTATLNPVSSTEVLFVAAKQTVGIGPTVTVKSQTADGAYTLTVPIAAPLLGSYGTGALPIALSSQATSTAAGKYAVETSAIGYLTQSVNVDISTTDAIQNFILLTP